MAANRCNIRILIGLMLALSLISVPAAAQNEDGQAGTRSLFSEFGFGARAMGLGNAYVALADDPTAVFWNPAGLDYIYQQSVTFFHASLYEGTMYDFLGYTYPTLDLGTFAVALSRISTGDIVERTRDRTIMGTFDYQVYRGYLSYGLRLPLDLAAGISMKVETSGFSGLSELNPTERPISFGLDFGVIYRPEFSYSPILRDWSVGVNIQNLFSPQFRHGNETDVFPMELRFGIMRRVPFAGTGSELNILLDLNKTSDTDIGFAFGTEYNFRGMGKARLGYNTAGILFGAGVEYNMFQIDYAFGDQSTDGLLGAVHRISLTVNFGMNRDEMNQIVQELRRQEEERIITEIREADKQKFVAEHMQTAEQYFREERYLDAIVEYQQVIGADPFNQQAKIMLDSVNTLLDREIQARQDQAVMAALDKERAAADRQYIEEHYEKGRLYLDQKQFTEALIEFNLALERDPDYQPARDGVQTTQRRLREELNGLVRQARREFENQNYAEALRLLSEARILSGDDPQVKKEVDTLVQRVKLQENIQTGLLLYDIGQYEDALQVFESILEQDPTNQFIQQYYNRSIIEARADTEPMDPETERRYLEGVDKFLLGRYQEAIAIWEEILQEHPYNKKVLEAISGAQERLKRSESN